MSFAEVYIVINLLLEINKTIYSMEITNFAIYQDLNIAIEIISVKLNWFQIESEIVGKSLHFIKIYSFLFFLNNKNSPLNKIQLI